MKKRGSRRKHRPEPHKKELHPHHGGHKSHNVHDHHHHTHKLLYVITILLIILILTIIFSYPLYVNDSDVDNSVATSLSVTSATCSWKGSTYEICETISWDGPSGTYAKPYIPGGEPLEDVAAHYENKFSYCQGVGSEDGYRIVRAMLFDASGVLKDVGKGVSCEDKPQQVTKLFNERRTYRHVETAQILTQQALTSRRTYAQGTKTLPFPDVVKSCTFTGDWITENDPWGRQRRYCHKASGSFSGYGDASEQYVINDPGYFQWAGEAKPRSDPPATKYEGHVMHMLTCSHLYYRDPEYYARATYLPLGIL
jgi:hypothetical protein